MTGAAGGIPLDAGSAAGAAGANGITGAACGIPLDAGSVADANGIPYDGCIALPAAATSAAEIMPGGSVPPRAVSRGGASACCCCCGAYCGCGGAGAGAAWWPW
jgi:hypothetical protein